MKKKKSETITRCLTCGHLIAEVDYICLTCLMRGTERYLKKNEKEIEKLAEKNDEAKNVS